MKIYSPNFFKPDFTVNKNVFKNQVEETPQFSEIKKTHAFTVKKIQKEKIGTKNKEETIALIDIVKRRVKHLKDYFYKIGHSYFKEEVV